MRIKAKFIGFFTLGLILFLFYIGLIVTFVFETVLPWVGIEDNVQIFLTVFMGAIISGSALFSFWFVRPIVSMLALIGEISAGRYNQTEAFEKLKKGTEN